jgi:RAB protein geranylgeranyltransferase component A
LLRRSLVIAEYAAFHRYPSLIRALSKSGYSVLQVDENPYYGGEYASLSLQELILWSKENHAATYIRPEASEDLLRVGHRFSLSLHPCVLPATGVGIDLIVKSRVSAYLQFSLLKDIGVWVTNDGQAWTFQPVPGTKAEIFNDSRLTLVEKRRLSKFLLAVSKDLTGVPLTNENSMSFF